MKNLRSNSLLKILSTLFVCTALSAAFISCDPVVEPAFSSEEEALAALNGTFAGSYESYTIDVDNSTFDAGSYSYAGDNMTIDFTSEDYTEGYIYIKYTRAYETSSTEHEDVDSWTAVYIWKNNSDNNDVQYSEPEDSSNYTKSISYYYRFSSEAPDVGKYYAISFKELSTSSISLSGAYKYGGATSTETLDEAKNEFTIDNGYYAGYSELVKQ